LVLLEKKKENEKGRGKVRYESFGAIGESIGHDKRGQPVYLRTPDGEEVLWEVEKEIMRVDKGKKVSEKAKIIEKIINDDLPAIAEAFRGWWH